MKQQKRAPIRGNDKDGNRLVVVQLASGAGFAVVDADDFDRLAANGLSPHWLTNTSKYGRPYVRAPLHVRGGLVGVARVILGAGPNEVARYHDDDPMNLRRENLYLEAGRAKRDDRALVELACAA